MYACIAGVTSCTSLSSRTVGGKLGKKHGLMKWNNFALLDSLFRLM